MWHYLPDRWSGAAASDLYRKVVVKALRRWRPGKAKYVLVEDNDPTGYKSAAARRLASVEGGVLSVRLNTLP